jgi:hypothetical protein
MTVRTRFLSLNGRGHLLRLLAVPLAEHHCLDLSAECWPTFATLGTAAEKHSTDVTAADAISAVASTLLDQLSPSIVWRGAPHGEQRAPPLPLFLVQRCFRRELSVVQCCFGGCARYLATARITFRASKTDQPSTFDTCFCSDHNTRTAVGLTLLRPEMSDSRTDNNSHRVTLIRARPRRFQFLS